MIVSKTPLRMSFVGGGSDLSAYYKNGYGAVVSTAIDKYVYVIVNKKFDEYIRIGYSQTELVNDINSIQHNIIREALKLIGGINKNIDIVYMADVLPYDWGTGLGASSSIAVGVLNALYAYKGVSVSAETLAKQACQIEIDVLGQPIGKQDQYAAAFGGMNYIRFDANEDVKVELIRISENKKQEMDKRLMLFNTNLNSDSKAVLQEQRSNTEMNNDVQRRISGMVEYADRLRDELSLNKIDGLGEMLHQNWLVKKSLASKISNSKIDYYYEKALEAGALGGKILGSGGGGFLLFFCEHGKQGNVRLALSDLKEMEFHFSSHGSEIIYNSENDK